MLVLTEKNEVYVWGNNSMGQAGIGNMISPTLVPRKVTALEGIVIRGISAGTSHSVAWTNSNLLT